MTRKECAAKNLDLAKKYYDQSVLFMNKIYENESAWPPSYLEAQDKIKQQLSELEDQIISQRGNPNPS